HRLFTFLEINHLPPTNNYAEQTLRHPVIFRKIIFGNRSDNGAMPWPSIFPCSTPPNAANSIPSLCL
ncbi:MAG: transposase, partial [Verrucomicrobiae bacterium]|nr:transposase [Verrucomicrobiae bacterium]